MTYGIQIYEDAALTVNPVLIESCYFDGAQDSPALSLGDVMAYCEEGRIGTADEFIRQSGKPLHDDRHGGGSFHYRIREGDGLCLEILQHTDAEPVVEISVTDAYGYSVVYYDGIRR